MCHWRHKFITLFWSGKTQKRYPALELPVLPLMYCIVLYCIVLYCIVLYCIVLYCIVLYCIVLYCIVLYCIVLYCIVLYCIGDKDHVMLYLFNQMILPIPFSSVMFFKRVSNFLLLLSV